MASPQEKGQCVAWFIETKSDTQVQRNFRTTYGKEPPSRPTIRAWHKKYMETGSILQRKGAGRPSTSPEDIERVRELFEHNPHKSIRTAARELQVPRSTIHKVLHKRLWLYTSVQRTCKMTSITEESSNKAFGGWQKVYSHESKELGCHMKFGVYTPPQAETGPVPVVYWLSGLTCTEQNFISKAGSQQHAARHGIMVVAPDTSPRGCNIDGEEESWDFGTGAGFYVDATEEKWKKNYRMYSYVTKELPSVIAANFKVESEKAGIMGHSMGGHGALICAFKNSGQYKSVSAFSPICNPLNCPWGVKAFTGYLGADKNTWKGYDACELIKKYNGPPLEIFVDQGKADNFLTQGQLLPDNLVNACAAVGVPVVMRMQEDYDHSYYFISTFMGDHFDHHAKFLKA